MNEGTIFRPWRWLSDGLRNVPIVDDVDRRNAPTLQIVLLMLAALPSSAWLYRVVFSPLPWRPGEFRAMLMSAMVSLAAALSFALIRRGRFQLALRVLLTVVAVTMMDAYLTQGMAANRFEAPLHIVWIIVAGLMGSRRLMWLLYLWIVLAFAVGASVDIRAPDAEPWQGLMASALIMAVIFLFVALVVDRTSMALRESLAASRARGDELALSKMQLEAEIIERERIHGQLIHSQKIEIVGRLAAGVAHDFNHFLSLILGYVAQGRDSDDAARLRGVLDGIDGAARRASAVSRKLTTFSRRDESAHETFDVNGALEEMQSSLRQLLAPEVHIAFKSARQPQNVFMDRNQFELVVLNIAANAGEAMPEGGRLTIELHPIATNPASVEIRFSDTGQGMDTTTRERVFEPFFTTRAAGKGTGLGLAIAADVVSACGGRIEVVSAPGEGTTFCIYLPLASRDSTTRELAGSERQAGSSVTST